MKFPSLTKIVQQTGNTFLRFPLAIIMAITGTVVSLYILELDIISHDIPHHDQLVKLVLIASIGLTFFIFLQLLFERLKLKKWLAISLKIFGLLLLIYVYYFIPNDLFRVDYIRLIIINIAFHFFVAVAPFFVKNEINGFWQFNKTLFIRGLTSVFYSLVLYAGLAITLVIIRELFDVNIHNQRFGELFILIIGIVNTLIFLAGVPSDHEKQESQISYPIGIKIFAQYILIPIILIDLAVLYIYMGTIIIGWKWPVGFVSSSILMLAVVGIFTLLLLYPPYHKKNNKWLTFYVPFFNIALLPLIVMLALAIWRRVSEYGFTELRYYVVILTIWLAVISIFQIINGFKNIKVIPISLGIILLITSFGPWSSVSVSKYSQINRLKDVLNKYDMLVDNKIIKVNQEISSDDSDEIQNITKHLEETYGHKILQPMFTNNLDSVINNDKYYDYPSRIVSMIKDEYIEVIQSKEIEYNFYNCCSKKISDVLVDVSDIDYVITNSHNYYDLRQQKNYVRTKNYSINGHQIMINFTRNLDYEIIYIKNSKQYNKTILSENSISINIDTLINKLENKYDYTSIYNAFDYDIDQDDMTIIRETDWLKVTVEFHYISVKKINGEIDFCNLKANIHIKDKRRQ